MRAEQQSEFVARDEPDQWGDHRRRAQRDEQPPPENRGFGKRQREGGRIRLSGHLKSKTDTAGDRGCAFHRGREAVGSRAGSGMGFVQQSGIFVQPLGATMLSIPGKSGSTCDGFSRREFLRVGGVGILGMSLADILQLQAAEPADAPKQKAGWGKAKSLLFVFLQGGPSHIDIWDPKPDAPDNIRGEFKPIKSNVPGIWLSEVMPKLAQQMDKATLIRSVSYTPAGLFNHTAAIYQMMTGYTPDKVSPSGQLEPPAPSDYPHMGCEIARFKPLDIPTLPFVMLPRPLQESNVIGKGGTAGFLGAAFDPYYFYQDPAKEIKIDDLGLRKDVSKERMARRETLLRQV